MQPRNPRVFPQASVRLQLQPSPRSTQLSPARARLSPDASALVVSALPARHAGSCSAVEKPCAAEQCPDS